MKTFHQKYFSFAVAIIIAGVLALVGATHAQQFVDATQSVGLTGLRGTAANWIDYNNDGFVDLYVSGQLWKNIQGKRFELVTDIPLQGSGTWADYDNDGYIDMFSWQGNGRLFHNIKGKNFEWVKDAIPPLPMKVSRGASWFAWDSDGLLDLYVGGYETWTKGNYPDVILQNQGDGTFKEVWREHGERILPARGITAADYNENGTMDIYVSNYRLFGNFLWKNDGNGNLTDVALKTHTIGDGVMVTFGKTRRMSYGHTIGSAWGDFDNDGHLDLFVGNFSHPANYQDRPNFLKNMGPEQDYIFKDKTKTAGLKWQESYASPALADFDNDGKLDLFFTAVYGGDHSVLYRNTGNWHFVDVTEKSGIVSNKTYQAAWGDFNNDGYPDLVTDGRFYQNKGGSNSWLKVKLTGKKDHNRSAIGAQVRVYLNDKILTRQLESATGEGNQNDMRLLFGLGDDDGKVKVEVRWLDGKRQKYFCRPSTLLKVNATSS